MRKNVEQKGDNMETNTKKINFFSKMSTKFAYLILIMIFIPLTVLILIATRKSSSTMEETYKTYALNLAEEAATGIDFAVEFGEQTYGNYAKNLAEATAIAVNTEIDFGETVYKRYAQNLAEEATVGINLVSQLGLDLDVDRLTKILGSIKLNEVEGSYAYMVSPTGTMLWHPTTDKIGNPVENAAVKGIVADLQAGKKVENGSVLYEYKGALKLAGYAFTAKGDIVIVTADYDKFVTVDYDGILGNVTIEGVAGSYAYMVGQDGTMLWHTNKEKIGQPVENAAVKGIVEKLAAGKTVGNDYCLYDYKGAKKLAGYAFASNGNIIVVTADYNEFMKIDYDSLLGNIEITNVEGSYAYMVGQDGTMLWHTNKDKVGQPVENAAVKGIVEDLAAGKTVENNAVVYEYNGADKLAGYAFAKNGNIIIVTADYDKFIAPITALKTSLIVFGIIAIIVCAAVGLFAVTIMMKGFEKLVPIINNTANLDLRHNEDSALLAKRKDEVGLIAKELDGMTDNLRGILGKLDEASEKIDTNVNDLYTITVNVNSLCTDNSATSEQLAAGMEETSASTESINENLGGLSDGANDIANLANNGTKLSEEIMVRATDLRKTTEAATKKTTDIYESVKVKSEAAMEASKAVEKINELTDTIMAISSQTSLLALNAAIEAARAGEAGRGFSVVASEIGNLATQTSTAVADISGIVTEVNQAVKKMSECLEEMIAFLESNVITDYADFGKVSLQYHDDAEVFKGSMNDIKAAIETLHQNINSIVEAISGINTTIADSANGVTDIAQKTTDMVTETSGSEAKVSECKDYVADLNEIIKKFQMD